MNGYETLWVPGTDHAGIATQVIVEKKIKKERGITRHDLGREDFLKEVWKWKEEHGRTICKQLRRLGTSVDWKREAFTMDEKCANAVTEAFVRLFHDGLLYRANRLVNWSCSLRTAISDIEVDYIDLTGPKKIAVPGHAKMVEFGVLHSFAYKFVRLGDEKEEEEIVVSTTRLETMLGDVAVAVHPDDARYKKYHGRKLRHPFVDRELLLITDSELVDMSFGTGAVKITPAHDPNDFKCGKNHGLPFVNILNDDGSINQNGGIYAGKMRYDVRYLLIEELTKIGLFRGTSSNPMRLGTCSRSKDIVEPIIRPQWFVRCETMGKRAVDAVRSGELQLLPRNMHEPTWYGWMENIQDWCVSRQLWWGHQIPAYLVIVNGSKPSGYDTADWVVAKGFEDALVKAKALHPGKIVDVERDQDVLDTWFSSGLFPFSVLGWPENTEDFNAFYPTTLLETGHDILFFWVARMVMMGQQLTGKLPFTMVYLHAMVRDKYGRKMSKSLGNVLDPIHVIEGVSLKALQDGLRSGNLDPAEIEKACKGQEMDFPNGIPECGADALRFGLLAYTTQGRDINLDINRVIGYRQFANKLWNATRFALNNFSHETHSVFEIPNFEKVGSYGNESFVDKWVLHQLLSTCQLVDTAFTQYDFASGGQSIYDFWYNVCDYYLELIKPVMNADQSIPANAAQKQTALAILYTCLDHGLKLLHPIMPFVTEELYQRLPGRQEADSIVIAEYPHGFESWKNDVINADFKIFQDIVHATRSSRVSMGIEPAASPEIYIQTTEENLRVLSSVCKEIATLCRCSSIKMIGPNDVVPTGTAMTVVNVHTSLHVVLSGLINFEAEIQKQTKKKDKLNDALETLRKKMAIPGWKEKSPVEILQQTHEKVAETESEISKLETSITLFTKLLKEQSN